MVWFVLGRRGVYCSRCKCQGGQSCSVIVGSGSGLLFVEPLQEEVIVQFATGHDVFAVLPIAATPVVAS